MKINNTVKLDPTRDWPDWAQTMKRGLPALLSRADAAEFLNVGERTIDRRRRSGELESVKVGGRILIPAEALVAALVSCRERAAS